MALLEITMWVYHRRDGDSGANLCDFFIKQKIFFLYLTQTYDMSFFVYL